MCCSILKLINKDVILIDDAHGIIKTGESFKSDIYNCSEQLNDSSTIVLSCENSYVWLVVFFAAVFCGKSIHILDPKTGISGFLKDMNHYIINSDEIAKISGNIGINSEDNEFVVDQNDRSKLAKVYLYSTGTSSARKSILFNSEKIVKPSFVQGEELLINNKDVVAVLPPFAHAYGLSAVLSAMSMGAKIVIFNNHIDFAKALRDKLFAHIFAPPNLIKVLYRNETYLQYLVRAGQVILAGARLDDSVYRTCLESGVKLVNMYGSTETGMCFIGKSIAGRDGNELFLSREFSKKINNDGELCIKGDAIGLLVNDSYGITDNEGWYHTKDLVLNNENGSFKLIGRIDSVMVLNNGYKINIEDLEARIVRCTNAKECQIFVEQICGTDSVIAAIQEPENSGNDLLQLINSNLQYYEQIKEIRFVTSIKQTNGKKRRINRDSIINLIHKTLKQLKMEVSPETYNSTIPFLVGCGFDSLQSLQFIMIMEEQLQTRIDILQFDPQMSYDEMINFFMEQVSLII